MRLPKDLDSHTYKPYSNPVGLWKTRTRDEEDDVEEESEDDFDTTMFVDDGVPLVDDNGADLVPFDHVRGYDEADAFFLCCFAGTYREVRGKLQATRMSREQKTFRPGKGSRRRKGKGKGRGKRRPFIHPRSSSS